MSGNTPMTVSYPAEDTTGFIRNPAMGWAVYIDAFERPFPNAEAYWERQDPNVRWASILYVRVAWSDLEPEEGRYAWVHDDNYRRLIEMALERNLKLAFRVYVDSKDASRQATPQFVFDAGAQGYVHEGQRRPDRTPFLHDSVFQRYFSRFVRAFAAEYDNPDFVDFIDAQGLGWWGEMHNVDYLDQAQKKQVFEWIVRLYSDHFTHVLLGAQYGANSFDFSLQDWALREKGYMIRRDSFGSPVWLTGEDKRQILAHWPAVPVFAENCYHSFAARPQWYRGDGFPDVRDMMARVVEDAKELHANTLDLRIPEDAEQWMRFAPDLVEDFALNGGYRLVPVRIAYAGRMAIGHPYTIEHGWKNAGVGKIPNNMKNWNRKYKVAFALLDPATGRPVYRYVDREAEPSDWIKGAEYAYRSSVTVSGVPEGSYRIAVAIVNTATGGEPAIRLAVRPDAIRNGWVELGTVEVATAP